MSSRPGKNAAVSILIGSCVLLAFPAISAATCGVTTQRVYVGNTATDSQCNFSTIQAAIDSVVCPGTAIVVTNELTYGGQNLVIADKSLSITGTQNGLHCGLQVDPGGAPTKIKLDVTGTNQSAITITGNSNVTLNNLEITGGTGPANAIAGAGGINFNGDGALRLNSVAIHGNSGSQGGVGFYGSGSLILDGATIYSNQAGGSGGGVSAYASSGSAVAMLIVDDAAQATEIYSNTSAVTGGGISLQGAVHLTAVAKAENRIDIYQNSSQLGAGIDIEGPAIADIALPTPAPSGGTTLSSPTGIYSNSATSQGGGIHVEGGTDGAGVLRLFDSVSNGPTNLYGNSATQFGGALVVSTGGIACVYNIGMSSNNSATGAAFYVGDGGRLYINAASNTDCHYSAAAAAGAVQCDPSMAGCNNYAYNVADTGTTAYGGIVEFAGSALIQANRLHFRKNSGAYFADAIGASTANISFNNCLIADNSVGRLVSLYQANIVIDSSTMANNGIPTSSNVFNGFSSNISVSNSIVDEPGVKTLYLTGTSTSSVSYVLSNDITTLPSSPNIVSGDPQFISASTGDYHVMVSSPAIDFAPASPNGSIDLDQQPRTVDLPGTDSPGTQNNFGPRDLGAYEYQVGNVHDRIFLGTFEGP